MPVILPVAAGVAAIAAGYYYYATESARAATHVDPEAQTVELPDGSRVAAHRKDKPFKKAEYDNVTTVYEAYARGRILNPKGNMMGSRIRQPDGSLPYVWMNYDEVFERSAQLAAGFLKLGLTPGQEALVGICSKNRPEWIITELAIYTYNMVIVPLYETLGQEELVHVCKLTSMKIVIVETPKKAALVVKNKSALPDLLHIVVIHVDDQKEYNDLCTDASTKGLHVSLYSKLLEMGKDGSRPPAQLPKSTDLATVCFTSGTTGVPKGVQLTHGNVAADLTPMELTPGCYPKQDDVLLSFLPLAHMFERMLEALMFSAGGSVGYYRGDLKLLLEDIQECKPTFLGVVPRVLNRIYDKVIGEASKSPIKLAVLKAAIAFKSAEMKRMCVRNDSFVDKIVFKKIREILGGRIRIVLTGSAPLAEPVLMLIRATLGCPVLEGYGQTECVAAATLTIAGEPHLGHVGIPIPAVAVKLVDVPDMNYYAAKNGGEVCIKGHTVTKGYYKNPEETAKAIDADGWLHTGDIGMWTKQGTLKIIDRKKHIFKLAQGEYVAPEKIENVYMRSTFVAQVFVYGESLRTSLIAIIIPDVEIVVPYFENLDGKKSTLEELCKRADVEKIILDDMVRLGKKEKLTGFEQVKALFLCHELFSIENDMLTPTMKSKRPQIKKRYAKELAATYARVKD